MFEENEATWKDCMLLKEAKIKDVINCLNETGFRIVLVVDEDEKLIGVVTDGDLRRALIKGNDLDTPCSKIMQFNPICVDESVTKTEAVSLMKRNQIRELPIIDGHDRLVGLQQLDTIIHTKNLDNLIVIMAGGFGKRMGEHTKNLPKPMLKIGDKPMIRHIIDKASNEGFKNFLVSLHYLPDIIEDYLGDGSQWGVNISYTYEKKPLGTAGALGLLEKDLDHPIIVTNGDVMTELSFVDILDFHLTNKAHATMATLKHVWQNPFGVVKTEGILIRGFEEKPLHTTNVNAGVYVLEPDALDFLYPDVMCDMPTLFERLRLENKTVIAFPIHEPWRDVGRPEDLYAANREV